MKNPLFNRHRFDHHEHDTGPETSVASANECTGLMFIPPEDQAQWESYQQLSPMAIPPAGTGDAWPAQKLPRPGRTSSPAQLTHQKVGGWRQGCTIAKKNAEGVCSLRSFRKGHFSSR